MAAPEHLSRSETCRNRKRNIAPGSVKRSTPDTRCSTRGGSSLDATIAAVRVLEDNPLFNAGRGAVLTPTEPHN